MTIPNSELKRGDCIRITFGSRNSQLAIVDNVTPSGNVHVWKFSASRGVWKGPIRLHENEAMNREPKAAFTSAASRRSDYGDKAKNEALEAAKKAAGLI